MTRHTFKETTVKPYLHFSLLVLVASLTACATHDAGNFDYQSQRKSDAPKLESPPDVTQLSLNNRNALADGAITANHFQSGLGTAPSAPTAVSEMGGVHVAHDGSQRWLVVERPTERLWEQLHDFWQANGYLLTVDERSTGIMETDWAEHRANLPQDIVRGTMGKLIDSTYSSSALDRFRTRLEHSPDGATEIYISHRGMVEAHNNATPDHPDWQTTPSDSELEAEMLRRLMVKLGTSQTQSLAPDDMASPSLTVHIAILDGPSTMKLNEDFDRAWRRVGLALDRTGFTVEDRDRSTGVYFVRYVTPNPDKKEPGIFTKMLDFAKATPTVVPLKFRILVTGRGETSAVSVLNEAGSPDATENARRIVKVIADDMG
jgi:outer membrane protein assembly factor BamC